MKRGFSYIEILVSLLIITFIVISSTYTLSLMLSLERSSQRYKTLYYYLNRYWEFAEISLKEKDVERFFNVNVDDEEDSILIKLKDKKSGRVFYIYRSKIINF